jgi:hypothetical protein
VDLPPPVLPNHVFHRAVQHLKSSSESSMNAATLDARQLHENPDQAWCMMNFLGEQHTLHESPGPRTQVVSRFDAAAPPQHREELADRGLRCILRSRRETLDVCISL